MRYKNYAGACRKDMICMRKTAAIVICKLANAAGRLIGRGSSKPGQLALRICPDIIRRLKMPDAVVAVTGSNGKTSTVEMIVRILEKNGKKVCWNKEGSNQIEGIATMLIANATLSGRVKSDVVVMESDEQYARLTFKYICPTHFVILNLLRDQLTRNGHPEYIYSKIAEAVYPGQKLILNADDPIVSQFAEYQYKTVMFGVSEKAAKDLCEIGVYDDGAYCPVCGGKMTYAYRCYGSLGRYSCEKCGYARRACAYELTEFDLATGEMVVNGGVSMKTGIRTAYHAYNMLAAFAVASELGVPEEISAGAVSDYFLKNGRVRCWQVSGRKAVLLTSKHENSTSYNQSLSYAAREGGDVLIIVDAVSRKYFTGETSWLWDIDFGVLKDDSVKKVYVAGKYVYDIAERLDFTDIDKEKIEILKELDEIRTLFTRDSRNLYVITCFSDRDKFISRLPDSAEERSEAL